MRLIVPLLVLLLDFVHAVIENRPNIIYLLVDDWGGGDVDMCPDSVPIDQCPFRPTDAARKAHLHTPRIKQMAEEGQILSNFYSPRSTYRAGMLAGRDPARYGMIDNLFPILLASDQRAGMPTSEKSIAKYMKELGYNTGFSGKWHLGMTNGTDNTAFTPINHGFDFVKFFIEGSNGEACNEGALNPPGDNNIYHMCSFDHIQDCDSSTGTCKVVEQPIRWENVTSRMLRVFQEFVDTYSNTISTNSEPFFYWHSFTAVHVPWVPSRFFVSDPVMKYWTDYVSETDWAVGYILEYLKIHAPNTMVVLSSDNGPYKESASSYCPSQCTWMTPEEEKGGRPEQAGCSPCDASIVSLSTSTNIGGKGNTWEGGLHVPAVAWWPGKIASGTINPVIASGLDLLPTFVSLAGGALTNGITYDGYDISSSLLNETVKPDDAPIGTFVYWCGLSIQAVRINEYKVLYRTQNFVGKYPNHKTPPNLCGQGGDCCVGSVGRLCLCIEPFVTIHNTPIVIDLITNPREDLSMAVSDTAVTERLIGQANEITKERLRSTLGDRGLPSRYFDADNITNMMFVLGALPNFPNVDICEDTGNAFISNLQMSPFGPYLCDGDTKGNYTWFPKVAPQGCHFLPEACQKSVLPGQSKSFYKYQNCSINGNFQGPECALRLPCCKQDGYMGPFEYVKPTSFLTGWEKDTEQCGCFDNGSDSYFPDDEIMKKSVCDWQKDVYTHLKDTDQLYFFLGFCKPSYCSNETYDQVPHNQALCDSIKKYGLNDVPTGSIFNEAYPDTQFDLKLAYPNQVNPPPTKKPTKTKTGKTTAEPTEAKTSKTAVGSV